jgi:hypothetical protein
MTYRLGVCAGEDPYPHNASHNDQGTTVMGNSPAGINGSIFLQQTFSSMTCDGHAYKTTHITLGRCVNTTAGVEAFSFKWIRGFGG